MRTFRLNIAALGLLLLGAGPAFGLDGGKPVALDPQSPFASVRDALRSGVRDLNAGDKEGAVRALKFAATQGHTLALWKLGSMYAAGDGVAHNDLTAFEYFSKLADENAELLPDSPEAPVVAAAFVALGAYFLEGIPGTYVRANPRRAYEMFHYAASYFRDGNAQFSLARLYLDGRGAPSDPLSAARWLKLAAEKGHYPSQALLGHMLVKGEGVPQQRPLGLMWLTLARDAADPVRDDWIEILYAEAISVASDSDRRSAHVNLEHFLNQRR